METIRDQVKYQRLLDHLQRTYGETIAPFNFKIGVLKLQLPARQKGPFSGWKHWKPHFFEAVAVLTCVESPVLLERYHATL